MYGLDFFNHFAALWLVHLPGLQPIRQSKTKAHCTLGEFAIEKEVGSKVFEQAGAHPDKSVASTINCLEDEVKALLE